MSSEISRVRTHSHRISRTHLALLGLFVALIGAYCWFVFSLPGVVG